MRGVCSDDEGPLPKLFHEGAAALDSVLLSGHDDEKLARLRSIRVSEYRCGDIPLAVPRMLRRKMGGRACADRAHRQMNGAAPQSGDEAFNAGLRAPERDV